MNNTSIFWKITSVISMIIGSLSASLATFWLYAGLSFLPDWNKSQDFISSRLIISATIFGAVILALISYIFLRFSFKKNHAAYTSARILGVLIIISSLVSSIEIWKSMYATIFVMGTILGQLSIVLYFLLGLKLIMWGNKNLHAKS